MKDYMGDSSLAKLASIVKAALKTVSDSVVGLSAKVRELEDTAIVGVNGDNKNVITATTDHMTTVMLASTVEVDGINLSSGYIGTTPDGYLNIEALNDSGAIQMTGTVVAPRITGIGEPQSGTDAVNADYLDQKLAKVQPERAILASGETYTNNPTLIREIGSTAVNSLRVLGNIGSGGPTYGQGVHLFSDGSVRLNPTTSGMGRRISPSNVPGVIYIDDKQIVITDGLSSIEQLVSAATTLANGALQKSGGTMTGSIVFNAFLFTDDTPCIRSDNPKADTIIVGRSYTSGARIGFGQYNSKPFPDTVSIQGVQAPVNGTDAANKEYVDSMIPSGAIMMFNGDIDFPEGWIVCDGSTGTPNIMSEWPTDFGGVPVVWAQKW